MRRRLLRGLAAHPVDRLEGALLGAAAGSVGDRHELRRESAEAAHGVAKALLGRRGRRWKVLEGKARHRARLPGNETALGGGAAEVLGHGRHSVQAATERLGAAPWRATPMQLDRKSTRLNSSH